MSEVELYETEFEDIPPFNCALNCLIDCFPRRYLANIHSGNLDKNHVMSLERD